MPELKQVACAAALFLAACQAAPVSAETPPATPRVETDIVYGAGTIHASTSPEARPLQMDAYLPARASTDAPVPAIIMAHGGSFHRGTKGDETFYEEGAQNSSMASYCRAIAEAGIACFSIEYRLTPDDPALERTHDPARLFPESMLDSPGATARIDFARARMGLEPLNAETRHQYWNAIFAAAEDMTTAVEYVRAHAEDYSIDPDRVAVGGFSAGAITAINTAYGMDAPVRAVVALSGAVAGYNPAGGLPADPPPLLMFNGQNDLAGIILGSRYLKDTLTVAGSPPESAWVPGFGHFYPMGATSLGADLTKDSVERRVIDFLKRELEPEPLPTP